MHFEVEQKFPISDTKEIEDRLARLGATPVATLDQSDLYLKHPVRDFALTDEALRIRVIRDSDRQHCVITYKGPKLDSTTKTRREIELPLSDTGDGPRPWRELFAALGFEPVAEVRKRRRPLTLSYNSQAIEIAIDDVEGLGSFVELEISADEHHLDSAKNCLAALAKELGLADSERRSYLELLLGRNRPPSAVG